MHSYDGRYTFDFSSNINDLFRYNRIMAGIFGNSKEDRFMERQLNEWLDRQEYEMNDDIEITQEEALIFIKVVSNFPNSWSDLDDDAVPLIGDFKKDILWDVSEDEYNLLMKMWDRIKPLT